MKSYGSFLETVYDVLFEPRQAMQAIAEQRLTGQALAMFAISMLVPVWTVYTGVTGMADSPATVAMFGVHLFASLVFWVLSAAVLSFIAELYGGQGTVLGLFAALGFSHLPRIAIIPAWVFVAIMPPVTRPVLMGIIGLAVVTWTLALNVAALRGAYGLSGAKAVLVLLTPILAVAILITVCVMFAGAAIVYWPFKA
ncbi:MAG TPA: Yip1 family protein [Methylomusa anaerophila]|uniref:Yip1 domain protein n=1 Tax=Methylomusa anaerophila TaxID=1930071 RepID=A0A348AJG5_9FIRM|nr:Yip1 family protein [Methylomusa anaerophila]BBB91213.1 Yip1 domain protein [Methylomusa anaerophila]HML89792.1 Yip1 family protein [Methylomusa anaerophila]